MERLRKAEEIGKREQAEINTHMVCIYLKNATVAR